MISFDRFQLDNGLKVLVHEDESTSMAVVNILYDVGARDEQPDKTGFAHLFEHLMFGGSVNIPEFDAPLERAGGHSNAFTNNDITNYYDVVPAINLETVFWLESDRMLSLAFGQESLDVQKNVVSEEFKQNYLNQPYGDAYLKLKPLAYKVHPYNWSTIGKELSHIENASMEEVKDFFNHYYLPNNAIMAVAGNVKTVEVEKLVRKWFDPIPSRDVPVRDLPKEPEQQESRAQHVEADVPVDAIYKAYHMCARMDKEFHTVDLMSDILSEGDSSRFYNELVKKQKVFSEIDLFHFGSLDAGLLVVEGQLTKGITFEKADEAIDVELKKIQNALIGDEELQKVKNRAESSLAFYEMSTLHRAQELAYFELLGNAEMMNTEMEKYQKVTSSEVLEQSRLIFDPKNTSTLYYKSNN